MRAAIFDLDGVVVFTDHYHFEAWKRMCQDQGWAFDASLNDQLRGVSRMESLQVILDHNGVTVDRATAERLAHQKNEYYKALLTEIDDSALVDGALDFIRALRERQIKISLGSASKNAPTVLERLGITPLFDAVVSGLDITRSKPDPQVFTIGAQRLGIPPAECVVFEDAASGVEAALAAGMHAVGFGDCETLRAADLCIASYDEITPDELVRRFEASATR